MITRIIRMITQIKVNLLIGVIHIHYRCNHKKKLCLLLKPVLRVYWFLNQKYLPIASDIIFNC